MGDRIRTELESGERFAFGANWRRFLDTVDEARIQQASRSLQEMLAVDSLDGLGAGEAAGQLGDLEAPLGQAPRDLGDVDSVLEALLRLSPWI